MWFRSSCYQHSFDFKCVQSLLSDNMSHSHQFLTTWKALVIKNYIDVKIPILYSSRSCCLEVTDSCFTQISTRFEHTVAQHHSLQILLQDDILFCHYIQLYSPLGSNWKITNILTHTEHKRIGDDKGAEWGCYGLVLVPVLEILIGGAEHPLDPVWRLPYLHEL